MAPYTQSIERLHLVTHEIDIGEHPANDDYVEVTIRLASESETLEGDEQQVSTCYLVLQKDAIPVLLASLDKFKPKEQPCR
jgi:hypothetical protein